jgi:hypothetical protein
MLRRNSAFRTFQGGFGIVSASVQPSTISRTSAPKRARIVSRSFAAPPKASDRSSIESWSSAAIASSSLAPCSIAIAATASRCER